TADTGSDESVKAMVNRVATGFSHIDILVNCAAQPGGQAPPPKLAQITDDAFYSDVNVKVMGYLRCAREVAPHMIQQRWGRMVSNLVGRWIDARDIAYVVTFLASPKAAAINGDVIPAGGGVRGSIYY